MRLLDKMERKLGRFAIKGLIMHIVVFNMLVYLLSFVQDDLFNADITLRLALIPELVMQGEVWRLITFIFIPPPASPIFIIFALLLIYRFGTGLEQEWGSFKFNIYYLVGILATIAGAMISGYPHVSPHYLNLSLLFGFARFHPNYEIRLLLMLPVKLKYIAWANWGLMGYMFLGGNTPIRIAVGAAVLNYFLFFGKEIFFKSKMRSGSVVRKAKYQQGLKIKDTIHKCTVCGITEKDDPQMEFRYCSTCEGDYEYCMDHLKNHEHIKKPKY
ncbi:rhomboid family intramembrane serine protease [Herbivorax sp. ANBcel31]|uniref:rhomboid family intramembrane serine protease n=1 Tax=Herbivorax sp. ANBcel31 TaxID=3069754 RepID=UPI0027B38C56|nr:rhomboid family intramembrane serine protease [Herbivorax sp. ANBcel31]MDQ2085417.1 rhomboid family intramembrane serine protease [Herbivorax sp. ANBcel31]